MNCSDVVQARRDARDLAGYDDNRRGPVNRETYGPTEILADSSVVADGLGGAGSITPPADYGRPVVGWLGWRGRRRQR